MASVKMGMAGRTAVGAAIAATLVAVSTGTANAASAAPVWGASSAYGLTATLGPVSIGKAALSAYPSGPAQSSVAELTVGNIGKVTGVASSSSGNAAKGTTTSTARIASAALDLTAAQLATQVVTAKCDARPGAAPTGTVSLVGASVKTPGPLPDLALPAAPAPNTKVTLPAGLGQAVLNEQIRNRDGSLTVNALRLTLAPVAVKGSLTVASATCKAGTAQAPAPAPAAGSITGTAVDDTGMRVEGVVHQLKSAKPDAPTCTTNRLGRCTLAKLSPGVYRLCVIGVRDGHSMPARPCTGPVRINGNHVNITFRIPPEHGKGH
ncbi:choice-of-anchor P family protein [Streptomyces sp. NPDC004111]|uniref:choice-of-anchor P family protein n=1 Tax=Streptomyces sp. NPDC004111 TaxID=3364690 RepID=UPI0036ACB406